MKGIKRTSKKHGKILGHKKGVSGKELFSYQDARILIYLPCYKYVLDNFLYEEVAEIRRLVRTKTTVLLDYETNCDIYNLSRPLSHAGLVRRYVIGDWFSLKQQHIP